MPRERSLRTEAGLKTEFLTSPSVHPLEENIGIPNGRVRKQMGLREARRCASGRTARAGTRAGSKRKPA